MIDRPWYVLGGIFGTEIIPAIIGLYFGYKFLNWVGKKWRERKNATKKTI